ncbi:MAG TPA: hypothetical protein O0X19_01440 [Methanocorpusculum sp.]|nr:hypothetical protein [Candidatus Methanocorpusculum equi]MCQ2357543.1 hypothetical protein [Methanocorpusculum sp.]HJJ33033.1 hypothetical protein [Methanocorpusculum sp.]HJJ44220.1 hypothetical protein [Methanocorpusculum sp.]HJJ57982.1 hypothetical protein [Methanocorpusculum sp.]
MTGLKQSLVEKTNDTQLKILGYLKAGIAKGGRFFKAKYIAEDLGLTSKEVGTNLAILSEICEELEISRWSYSNSTTWRVTEKADGAVPVPEM